MNQCFCCFTLSTKGSKYRINVASWVCTQLPINFYFLWNISYDALHHITSPYLNKRPQIIVASKYCNLSLIRLCCRYLITTFRKALNYNFSKSTYLQKNFRCESIISSEKNWTVILAPSDGLFPLPFSSHNYSFRVQLRIEDWMNLWRTDCLRSFVVEQNKIFLLWLCFLGPNEDVCRENKVVSK